MTYIVIGLGNFGISLAERLTRLGHDVIGVDSDINLVEEYKNTISSTICLNLVDSASLKMLPLDDAHQVIVTLGEKVGNSVLIVALLKQHGVKHLVARAGSKLHQTILEAIGVDEVIMPESYAADLFALSAESPQIKGAYPVTDTHQFLELEIPHILVSQTLIQANLNEMFHVQLVGVKRRKVKLNVLGANSFYYEMADLNAEFNFQEYDRILLFGEIKALHKLQKKLY